MIVVVGAGVVIAILAVALWPGEREPEYHGKKLSLWLEQARSNRFPGTSETAAMAVRRIGTNGLAKLTFRVRITVLLVKVKTPLNVR